MRTLRFASLIVLMLAIAVPAAAQSQTQAQQSNSQPQAQQSSGLTLDQVIQAVSVAPQLFAQGAAAASAGKNDQALVDYSLFLLMNPTLSEGYVGRAQVYEAMGNLDQALQDLNQALSYKATSTTVTAGTYVLRAQLYIQQNDLQSAMDDLDSSLKLQPDATTPLVLRARLNFYQGNFDTALTDYNHLIQLQPDESSYYTARGEISVQQGQVDAAMADFDHAIELNPNDDQAYADRALLHQSQSDLTGALDDINNAIRINPQVSQYYLMRGGLHALAENASSSAGDYLHWLVLNQTRYLKAPNTLTSSQAFTVQMAPGWVYVIPFKVTAGQTISVAASGTTPQDRVDPLLVILDIHGDPLVGDDDSGGNYNAAINGYVIPEDGEYTLILGGAGGGDQGDITVSLNLGN